MGPKIPIKPTIIRRAAVLPNPNDIRAEVAALQLAGRLTIEKPLTELQIKAAKQSSYPGRNNRTKAR